MLSSMEVCTIWLAIDPASVANGCMQVVPRTHHNGFSAYEPVSDRGAAVFGEEIRRDQFDARAAVPVELARGEYSIHDAKLIHGSAANTGTQRRCGYTMRYMSTRAKFNAADYPLHQIYLARGRDHAGNTYADPNSPDAEKWQQRMKSYRNGH
jgi:ectoine hydroxylase-related dioxygenase (phytanoyl-CoA dioxygenase family)